MTVGERVNVKADWCNPRHARTRTAPATILGQKSNQRVHALEVRRVDQLPAGPALRDQARALQMLKMERERRRRDSKPLGDDARCHSVRTSLHKQAINGQPVLVCQGTERGDRFG